MCCIVVLHSIKSCNKKEPIYLINIVVTFLFQLYFFQSFQRYNCHVIDKTIRTVVGKKEDYYFYSTWCELLFLITTINNNITMDSVA